MRFDSCKSDSSLQSKVGGHDAVEIMSPLALLMRAQKEVSRGRVFKLRTTEPSELEGWYNLFVQQNTHTDGPTKWPQEYEKDKGWVL